MSATAHPGPLHRGRLFDRLKAACPGEWSAYIRHPFVQALGDGRLPEHCFRHYLVQDYLFLIQFSRAYALAVYKSATLADMRAAAAILNGLLETEIALHVDYCRQWGIDPASLESVGEEGANLAYTRFVLDTGMQGDVLDLYCALAPCVIGYAEIGAWLGETAVLAGNPYRSWIEMYAGDEYQQLALSARDQLDALAAARLNERRFDDLCRIFRTAARLEADFWQMGLDAPLCDAAE